MSPDMQLRNLSISISTSDGAAMVILLPLCNIKTNAMTRSDAQNAAFAKCLASRKAAIEAKAKTEDAKPTVAAAVLVEPVVEAPPPVPPPSPQAQAPTPPAQAPAQDDSDSDVSFVDAEELLEYIHAHTGQMQELRDELATLKAGHGQIVDDLQKAQIRKAHAINFV